MNWVNYDDVLAQLRGAGLQIDTISTEDINTTRPRRCKVDGEREKRGWFQLYEIALDQGDTALVGAFGVNRGADHGTQKISLGARKLNHEQQAAIKERIAADQVRQRALRKAEGERAARKAASIWARLATEGSCEYLTRKQVKAHGVRFSAQGAMAIPLLDTAGVIHGLQLIYPKGHKRAKLLERDKDFWPAGLVKQGHFFLIGTPTASSVMLLAEGYATGASLHEATGLPVAIAFDAGNLVHVAKALAARYRGIKLLVCGDDDHVGRCRACGKHTLVAEPVCSHCGAAHLATNAGKMGADTAALATNGAWLLPNFEGITERAPDAKGLSDFNDLQVTAAANGFDGLRVIDDQVSTRLSALNWLDRAAKNSPSPTATGGEGGGADEDLNVLTATGQLEDRFAIVYELGDTVFDAQEHKLVPMKAVQNLCASRQVYRWWMESLSKRIVRTAEVGFDPSEADPKVKCNLYAGWPTTPQAGDCSKMLELGQYLCSNDARGHELWEWLLKWLAYPVQHPGAKMKTAVLMHGPQGAGKNVFMEGHMAIYGEYGAVIGQEALEDKFNDYLSRRLYLIADEVVNRADMYSIKNKLKELITGDKIRINPKNVGSYYERNAVNICFFSNEDHPLALERDDRRHCVIYTPEKLPAEFYKAVFDEQHNGGIEAWHDYLLHLELGDFSPASLPPMTAAKQDLIELGLDSSQRFWNQLLAGDVQDIQAGPMRTQDLYELYRYWCSTQGVAKPAQLSTLIGALAKRPGVHKVRQRHFKNHSRTVETQSWLIYPPGADRDLTQEQLSYALATFADATHKLRHPERAAGAPTTKRVPEMEEEF